MKRLSELKLVRIGLLKTSVILLFLSFVALSCNESCDTITHVYENGYIRFNFDETPTKTFGHLRGKLKVKVNNNWVEVIHLGNVQGEKHWIIPRERVVYIGQEF